MSLGGKKSQSTTDTRLEGININQSNYGNPVALQYGQSRIPLMLLWYGNFLATPHTQTQKGGKGGGGGSSNTTFTYSASMIMGLCEGQITAVGQVWQDKVITTVAALGLTLFSGAGGQAVWSYLTTNFPSQAVPYDHTAYMAIANLQLGSSAALPNYTFEVTGFLPFNNPTIPDAEASAMLVDYCTDPNHGANFNSLNTAQFQGAGVLTWQSYVIAMGFFTSPTESTQRPAADFIKELLQITNSDCWMSAGLLNILPYADTSVTGNGRTYTPNLAPLFSFADDDLRPPGSAAAAGNDPIIIDRKPLANTYNTVVIEYLDRTNAYNVAIAQATDAQDIAVNGVRVMSTLTFHSITTGAVAQSVAQLILQRQLYIRSTFSFSVRADYCLLEPMDLVSITDTALGLVNKLVRIIEIDDDQNDNITIVAEDMLVGSASAPVYNFQAAQGFAANYGVAPPAVATPLIFTAPPLLVGTAGGYETWIAVDQGSAGSWGGADVYMSLDGTSYIYAGTINGAARYGTLTASLASHADPDTVDTLAVVLTNPTTTVLQLVTGSAADYNNLRTLLYVDGEIMAYQTATLTSAGHYNLTTLRRGQYGSSPALHAISSVFARIDAAIFRVPYDPGMIGQTIHFKFCSFNIFGKATQTLAAATDYTHVLAATNAGQLTPGPLTLVGRGVTVNGNSVFKSAATTAWDSDAYSLQGYTNGAFATWQPSQTNLDFMIGLGANPTTNSSYTSINYALYCNPNAGSPELQIYELGTLVFTGPAFAVGDLLSVTYDGAFVRYLQNGALLRQVPAAANLTLYLDSSFNEPQTAATNLQFGPYGTATPVMFIPRGNTVISDEVAIKQSGVSARDSDFYSINSYPACHVVFKSNGGVQSDSIVGLSQSPFANLSYTNIDFSFDAFGTSTVTNWLIIESGVSTGVTGPATIITVFWITYDGANIRYFVDGTLVKTTAAAGLTLFCKGSFNYPGEGINALEFGPSAAVHVNDSPELNLNAATVVGVASASNVTVNTSNIGNTTVIASVTVGPFPIATTAIVTATGTWTADPTHPTTAVNYSIASAVNSLPNDIQIQPIAASQQGGLAAEQSFALAAGVTQTYYLNGLSSPSSSPLNAYLATATIKVEVVKR